MQDFNALDPYAPVKPLDVLAEEIGVKIEDLVKLDANENLYGPVQEVRGDGMRQYSRACPHPESPIYLTSATPARACSIADP